MAAANRGHVNIYMAHESWRCKITFDISRKKYTQMAKLLDVIALVILLLLGTIILN